MNSEEGIQFDYKALIGIALLSAPMVAALHLAPWYFVSAIVAGTIVIVAGRREISWRPYRGRDESREYRNAAAEVAADQTVANLCLIISLALFIIALLPAQIPFQNLLMESAAIAIGFALALFGLTEPLIPKRLKYYGVPNLNR